MSALQLKWLVGRKYEGRNVVVVVGTPQGGVWMDLVNDWYEGVPARDLDKRLMTKAAVAAEIVRRVAK